MKYLNSALISLLIITSAGCTDNHLISDKNYRNKVDSAFKLVEAAAKSRRGELFSVFTPDLNRRQTEALKFLYAYMPLNDLADYTGEFFLENVNMSLKARERTPWGKSVPEDIFLHYVLPLRVNNENLDSFRLVCYDEIYSKTKDKKNIIDAALEINHWCQEKVTYQPSDSRTSAPLSTMLSARGRCGEESTLTVSALRTAGIPARQVYTPRWAHTDDNHAWVEVWSNGKWYYMGACEPEPVIDRGWFTEPARRSMLVHTKVFGAYNGDEIVINRYDKYSEINNLPKYADTKRIYVKTSDPEGNTLSNAIVEYQLYNYAEFYPLASVPSDENGFSSFITGMGDLLVWGRKGDLFDFTKISVPSADTILLTLRSDFEPRTLELDLDVPGIPSPLPGPSADLIDANKKLVEAGNNVRQKYIDSWINKEDAGVFALRFGENSKRVSSLIEKSMGNYRQIMKFLDQTPDDLRNIAVSLLEVIADKDLRDTRCDILSDHLNYSVPFCPVLNGAADTMFIKYVLNPRISNEILTAWRSYFILYLPDDLKTSAPDSPSLITEWIDKNIVIDDPGNYSGTAISPSGVTKLGISDQRSRAICFVAICRSLGIPSRLEPGSSVPQFWHNSSWRDVYFSNQENPPAGKGFLHLTYDKSNPVPEYYTHFTLARFSNGRYNTLDYDYNLKITSFSEDLSLTPGHYMMITGNRLSNGMILTRLTFFDLGEDEHKTVDVKVRRDLSPQEIRGKLDMEKIKSLLPPGKNTDKGVAVIWMDPATEPAKHVLKDLSLLKKELDASNLQFIFISQGEIPEMQKQPSNSVFIGFEHAPYETFINDPVKEFGLPLIIVSDKYGRIVYLSEGYIIGTGDHILNVIP